MEKFGTDIKKVLWDISSAQQLRAFQDHWQEKIDYFELLSCIGPFIDGISEQAI
jgi:hypothetical protein